MSQVLSIFDTNDLTTAKGAQEFTLNRDIKEITSFVDGVRRAVLDDAHSGARKGAGIDNANYLPSSSLRGDGGCIHWNCRLPKIRAMARYIALYCDQAIIPVTLPPVSEKADRTGELFDRFRLLTVILGIMELRPLLEADLAVLVPEELHLCKEHWDEAVPGHKRIVRAAQRLASDNIGRFSVTYHPPRGPLGQPFLNYRGPEEYLEHGEIGTVLDSVPKWIGSPKGTRPLRLTRDTVRRHGLVLRLFFRMANDAILQTYFGAAFDARYVTDSPGEAEFFRLLYGRGELARQTAALCARLAHTVPLMTDVPVRTILGVRRSEPEAFENYRSTMTEILKKHAGKGRSVSDAEAKDIYLDVLKPKLDALQAQASNLRKSQLKRSLLKVAASSALIGLGIYGGVLPSQLADLVKAIGGFSVAKDLAETLGAIEKNPAEIRNHNLYFLLRLKQETHR
jgi:hypothetical protein